jgi:Icc-related predicted phosphoesterase
MTRIVAISDTHGFHRKIMIPNGDIFVHCGDITRAGEMDTILDFADWLKELPHVMKVIVPGNHDFAFDISSAKFNKRAEEALYEVAGVHYLLDSIRVIEGLKFFGSPWVPNLSSWAFYDRNRDRFERAPTDIDVLVTHGPPAGVRDGSTSPSGESHHHGSKHLLRYVNRCAQLRLHVFGHVHQGYGIISGESPMFANAATCDEDYKPVNAPIVIEL